MKMKFSIHIWPDFSVLRLWLLLLVDAAYSMPETCHRGALEAWPVVNRLLDASSSDRIYSQ